MERLIISRNLKIVWEIIFIPDFGECFRRVLVRHYQQQIPYISRCIFVCPPLDSFLRQIDSFLSMILMNSPFALSGKRSTSTFRAHLLDGSRFPKRLQHLMTACIGQKSIDAKCILTISTILSYLVDRKFVYKADVDDL